MTKNQKLYLGLGVAAVLIYVYRKKLFRNSSSQTTETPVVSDASTSTASLKAISQPPISNAPVSLGKPTNKLQTDYKGRSPIMPGPKNIKMNPELDELSQMIFQKYGIKRPNKGDIITTSYGTYQLKGGGYLGWQKIKSTQPTNVNSASVSIRNY